MSDDSMLFDGKPCVVLYARGSSVRIKPEGGKERTVDASRVKPARSSMLTIGTPPRAGKMHTLAQLASLPGVVLASELRPVPKVKPWRSSAYRDYVRSFPCCAPRCATPNEDVQASHHGHHGIGTKPDDFLAVPLCRACHIDEYHQHGVLRGLTREETDAHVERVALELVVPWLIDKGLVVESLRALATPLREGAGA